MVVPACAPPAPGRERTDCLWCVGSQRWGSAGSSGVGVEGLEELCGGSALQE